MLTQVGAALLLGDSFVVPASSSSFSVGVNVLRRDGPPARGPGLVIGLSCPMVVVARSGIEDDFLVLALRAGVDLLCGVGTVPA